MARIVVTGASGRVGANVVKRLEDGGDEVVSCLLPGDRQEAKLDGITCEKSYFDILDTDAVARAIDGADAVVHTAAVMENVADKMPPSKFFDINVKGAFNVLEGIRLNKKNPRLICFSSTAAYDVFTCGREPLKESDERRPISLYGMNKILIEEEVRQYGFHHDVRYSLVRPNYVVAGPEVLDVFTCETVQSVLENFSGNPKCQFYGPEDWLGAKDELQANKDKLCIPRCPGGQSWRWHMTDVRDTVSLVERLLADDDGVGHTFNVAAKDACEWPDLVPYIAEVTGREVAEVEIPNLWQFSFDQAAAKEILGFEPASGHKAIVDAAMAMRNGEDVGIIPGEIAPLSFEPAS